MDMDLKILRAAAGGMSEAFELRRQKSEHSQITYSNGKLTQRTFEREHGTSVRLYTPGGGSGFAAAPGFSTELTRTLFARAASAAQRAPGRGITLSPCQGGEMGVPFDIIPPDEKAVCEFLREVDAYIERTYGAKLTSRQVGFTGHIFDKLILTSDAMSGRSYLPRDTVTVYMTASSASGVPVKIRASFGGAGQFADQFSDPALLFGEIDTAFNELMKKRDGVWCDSGMKTVVLDPNISGLFAHEAVGHTIESDGVLMGGVLRSRMGERIASELVTIGDYANSFNGLTAPLKIDMDDEGTIARDVVAIENGVLKNFLHSRQTAAELDAQPTGNARAYSYSDEPLVRMRNTVFHPGKSKLEDMIASVDDGYYFTDTEYGQSDTAGEFTFSVNMGYEIKGGKLGRAVFDTTISGFVLDVLSSVDMVSSDFKWWTRGSCGKKQSNQTGMGGPAIKCRLNVGGR